VKARFGDRSLFPDLEAEAYLNHAAISPPSTPVRERARAVLDAYARGGLVGFKEWLPQRARLKEKLAALIGGEAADLGFVPNTTTGVIQIAQAIDWQPGDRVVLFHGEFPANVTPWQRVAKQFELELVWVDLQPFHRSVEEGLEALRAALPARLVAFSAVEFQTGLAMPTDAIGALAHAHGAEVFVDAIQALGVVPLSAANVDYLASGSHKWLMGLEGAGFVYVAPSRVEALVPRLAGWLSHEDALDFLFLGEGHLRYDRAIRREADFVEAGAQNPVGLAALEASLDLIAGLGVDEVFAHVQRYHDAIAPAVAERGLISMRADHARSGSLCFRVPPGVDGPKLVAGMNERGVAMTLPDGRLRFAPHWPNDAERELPVILRALDASIAAAS